jgi:dihydroorotase-like cyclic amidohydrolase
MYAGMDVTGRVLATFVRGQKVYEDGEVIGEKGYGQWVKKVKNYEF